MIALYRSTTTVERGFTTYSFKMSLTRVIDFSAFNQSYVDQRMTHLRLVHQNLRST